MIRRAVLALILLGLAGGTAGQAGAGSCAEDRVDLRGPHGKARFSVEIADTVEERALGLMNRDKMAASHGMLFIYDREQPVAFWMENTLIPLDMLFIDSHGVVQTVHANARPLDRTSIPSGVPVQMVLEINGGLAARLGIEPGSELRHPRLDQAEAAWPCD
ncbi:DUF192 domain-containing protein [Frigidibacter sp. ROC022]|uniref:DUF192 domain-containing protein n=1 Tax=Frigidibacter sp. ROC022 TaxID=2971796 RepID=UPI00215B1E55|nr:DUF192 domain-containing protein [Frigidibacter sp. ROC022]MCR8725576.1 DUF192 domain-containing protein [Frigidibacter sp. ROC022]